ncbi:hypothetical protein JXA88_07865 [Candidatus Fermentibacteria bacterium]|nr:hypothetical protein [Candidatus Fermentibacteria bacterium]
MPRSAVGRVSPVGPSGAATFVALCAGAFGLGVVALLAPHVAPVLRWDGDVINQAVVEGYAKGREVPIFLMACIIVPLACVVALRAARLHRPAGPGSLLAIVAPAALLAWPAPVAAGIGVGSALAICGAAYALLTAVSFKGRARALSSTSVESPGPPANESGASRRVFEAETLGAIVLAGIGLASMIAWGPGEDFATLRRASIVFALVCSVLVGALWAAASGLLSLRMGRENARRVAAAGVFPLGGLVILNADPASHALRTAAVVAVIAACILAAVAAGRASAISRRLTSRLFWWVWAPAVLYATCYVHDVREPIDLYHEGERLTPAAAIAQGAAPYKEVFLWHGLAENGLVPQMGLARDWSVHGVRAIQHAVDPFAMVALYVLLAICLGSPLKGVAAAAVAAFTLPPPHGRYWLPFLAYAAMTMWLVRRCRDRRPAFAAGCLGALAVFYSLDGGIAAAVAVAATLAYGATLPPDPAWPRPWWRSTAAVLCGGLVGAAVPLIYLAVRGALPHFIQTSFSIVGGLSDRSSRPYPQLPWMLLRHGAQGLGRLVQSKATALYLPPFVIVWGLAHLAARRSLGQVAGSTLALPVVVAGSAAFFRAVIRRPDMDHVGKLLPLVFVVLVVLIQHHANALRTARRGAVSHAMALGVLLFLGFRIMVVDPETAPARILSGRLGPESRRDGSARLKELRLRRAGAGVVADPGTAAWIEHVVDYVNKTLGPNEGFYDFLNGGLLYFLADRPCPTRYVQTTYAASLAAQREVVASLAAVRPRMVLFPSGDAEKYGYDWLIHPLRHPLITRHLYRNYAPSALVDDTIILEARGRPIPRDQAVWNFIASAPFAVDVGHVPRYLGDLPQESDLVRRWSASEILSTWSGIRGLREESSPGAGLPAAVSGHAKALTSPPVFIQPDGGHTLVLRLACDVVGTARVVFASARRDTLDGSAAMAFFMEADDTTHTYRVDVGLLPAWVWRGSVTRLRLEFPDGVGRVRIESIELRAYRPEGEEPGTRSHPGPVGQSRSPTLLPALS